MGPHSAGQTKTGMNFVAWLINLLHVKKNILFLFAVCIIVPCFGQASYTTSCEIRNGTAYGYVHNHKNSFEINGYVWFYFYDSTGRLLTSEDEYEYEYVSSKTSEEIEHTNAPANACSCAFDVSNAVKSQNSPQPGDTIPTADQGKKNYTTTCEIRNGIAYGYVRNHENSFEINGYVWFHFYDSAGRFLKSEDEYEYEYVSSKTSEEIEHTTAPVNACSCFFEIKDAIGK
ncbi:MAG: hypothetical protein FD123_2633 [Bacteroidetes bacterium]|nr:MAG: hypothetical protein FD123_2633 [Bacteroidota bacterium]